MSQTIAIAIILLSALIHASFQLSVSILTLLNSQAIGSRKTHAKIIRLNGGFLFGVATITTLILSFFTLVIQTLQPIPTILETSIWIIISGIILTTGLMVWVFYYPQSKGTSLWIPRQIANYLQERTKRTKRSFEAFMLGMATVIGEIIFLAGSFLASAMALSYLSQFWQLVGISLYVGTSLLSLLIVSSLIGSGHRLSRIQLWRENNKKFLQFSAGSGLMVMAVFVYIFIVIGNFNSQLGL